MNSIHLAKRKKPLRRVDAPKPPEKKPEQAPKRKRTTKSFLNERLASIRREVESKKKDLPDSRDDVSDAMKRSRAGRHLRTLNCCAGWIW